MGEKTILLLIGDTLTDANNILTTDNILAGIQKWKEKSHWDRNFHNNLYKELKKIKANRLDEAWWGRIIDHLSNWSAIRPYSKSYIYQIGLKHLSELHLEYARILKMSGIIEPSIVTTSWKDI